MYLRPSSTTGSPLSFRDFQNSLQLTTPLDEDIMYPDQWIQKKTAQFGGDALYAPFECGTAANRRYGAVMNIIRSSGSLAKSLFVPPLFSGIRDAERAVCLRAVSEWKDPEMVTEALLPSSHALLGVGSVANWYPHSNRVIAVQYDVPSSRDSREVKELKQLCKDHRAYVVWIFLQPLKGHPTTHDPHSSNTKWGVIAQVGRGKRLATAWEAPCIFSSPMNAMKAVAQLALKDLRANPGYFSQVPSSTDPDDSIPPPGYVQGTTLSNAPSDLAGYMEWMGVDNEAKMADEIIPRALEAEFLAQRHLAQVAYSRYESYGTDLVGYVMRVTIGDMTPALTFVVPPVYKNEAEAKTAISIHAVHACRLEAILKELLLEFRAATWTERKFNYLNWHLGKVVKEFDARNKDEPTFDEFDLPKDQYECVITELSTLKTWSSGPQPSAHIALASATLEAWEGGIQEVFGLPVQYWPKGYLRDHAHARALAADRSQSQDSNKLEGPKSASTLSNAENEDDEAEKTSEDVDEEAREPTEK